jgi:hypothetical protein
MSKIEQWGGLAALLGGLLGVLYFPFESVASFAADPTEFTGLIPWSETFQSMAGPLLTFDSPENVLRVYARLTLFVILGSVAGLVALHSRNAGSAGRLEKWGYYFALVGMVLLATSLFAHRWLGEGDWTFFVEVPGLMLIIPGLPFVGAAALRAQVVPPLGCWLLILSVPGMLVLTILFGRLTGGLLVLDLAWVVLGYHLWRSGAVTVK